MTVTLASRPQRRLGPQEPQHLIAVVGQVAQDPVQAVASERQLQEAVLLCQAGCLLLQLRSLFLG